MKIAVTGYTGNLGAELVQRGCVPLVCDLLEIESVLEAVKAVGPDTVINCAAVSNVDACEDGDYLRALAVNGRGVANLREALGPGPQLIHLSTSYIFNGKKGGYKENSHDREPVQAYGWTKLFGELILEMFREPRDLCVRTVGLYGGHKPDFVSLVRQTLSKGEELPVTKKVVFNPTYIPHLAEALLKLPYLPSYPNFYLHLAGSEALSRYDFALAIANVFGLDPLLLTPVSTLSNWKAVRPADASLKVDLARKMGLPLYRPVEGLLALLKKELACAPA